MWKRLRLTAPTLGLSLVSALGCSEDAGTVPVARASSAPSASAEGSAPPPSDVPRQAPSAALATAPSSAPAPATASAPAPAVAPPPSASTRAVDAAPARRGRHGVFLWELDKNGPSAERAAELCARWGVGRVFIKSSEGAGGVRIDGSIDAGAPPDAGPRPAPSPSRWAKNFSEPNVAPFLARGIEVWAFGYFYPDRYVDPSGVAWGSLDEQITASVATLHDGVTGLVVDAEGEFVGKEADARRLCRGLRKKLGARKLAYTSFGWISAQKRFPFEAFDEGCGDAFLPQVYWAFGWPGGLDGSLERLRADIAARGLKAPVWPVQSNERPASASELERFFEQAGPDASIFYLHPDGSDETKTMSAMRW